MLIQIAPDLIVSTTTIRSITSAPLLNNGRECSEVTFTDGTRKIVKRSVEELEWCAGPVIPAPAGYSVVIAFSPDKDGEPTTFRTVPVLGFRLTDHEPYPITPWGKLDDHTWALVWPSGEADVQWDCMYDNVEAFRASFGPKGERS